MKLFNSLVLICAALMFSAAAALAQTALTVSDAELAVPFGAAKGHIALVGNQILFVAAEDPAASLAIQRADIAKVDRSGDVITVTTRRTLGDRDAFRFRMEQPGDLIKWYDGAAVASAAPMAPARMAQTGILASFQAKHDHRLGSCRGTLVLTNDQVAFESTDTINDSRQWQLVDIKEVKQDGAYRLEIKPFLGDTFNFELTGKGMDTGEFRRLVDRIARARATF